MAEIWLYSLRCHDTEDASENGDECRLDIRADADVQTHKRKMRPGNTWNLGIKLSFENKIAVDLWDEDIPRVGDRHDHLGTVVIRLNQPNGEGSFTGHGAHYVLEWGPNQP